MSYTTPIATDRDAVRFWVQDTDPSNELMSDDEIDYLLETWLPIRSSVVFVASMAAEVIAAKFTREVSVSADGVSVGTSELAAKYQQLAAKLRNQAHEDSAAGAFPDLGGVMWDEYRDLTIKPLRFGIGSMDNYEAGRQDYGDYDPGQHPYPDSDPLVSGNE
jgi:hypothetical protein